MTSRTFDAALLLRDIDDGAETATVAETGIALDVRHASTIQATFDVTALDTSSGNEAYALSLETDSLAAFSDSPVQVAAVSVSATGRYVLTASSELIAKLDPNAAAIRCKLTASGTTPSITYGCFLSPVA